MNGKKLLVGFLMAVMLAGMMATMMMSSSMRAMDELPRTRVHYTLNYQN